MRQLTQRQEKLLDDLMALYKKDGKELITVDDLDESHWELLKQFNDTEILWQEANRYITDKRFKNANG